MGWVEGEEPRGLGRLRFVWVRGNDWVLYVQDCLGGRRCKTAMIVAVSPDACDAAETKCSLAFATRVNRVRLGAVAQVSTAGGKRVKKLEATNTQLQTDLQAALVRPTCADGMSEGLRACLDSTVYNVCAHAVWGGLRVTSCIQEQVAALQAQLKHEKQEKRMLIEHLSHLTAEAAAVHRATADSTRRNRQKRRAQRQKLRHVMSAYEHEAARVSSLQQEVEMLRGVVAQNSRPRAGTCAEIQHHPLAPSDDVSPNEEGLGSKTQDISDVPRAEMRTRARTSSSAISAATAVTQATSASAPSVLVGPRDGEAHDADAPPVQTDASTTPQVGHGEGEDAQDHHEGDDVDMAQLAPRRMTPSARKAALLIQMTVLRAAASCGGGTPTKAAGEGGAEGAAAGGGTPCSPAPTGAVCGPRHGSRACASSSSSSTTTTPSVTSRRGRRGFATVPTPTPSGGTVVTVGHKHPRRRRPRPITPSQAVSVRVHLSDTPSTPTRRRATPRSRSRARTCTSGGVGVVRDATSPRLRSPLQRTPLRVRRTTPHRRTGAAAAGTSAATAIGASAATCTTPRASPSTRTLSRRGATPDRSGRRKTRRPGLASGVGVSPAAGDGRSPRRGLSSPRTPRSTARRIKRRVKSKLARPPTPLRAPAQHACAGATQQACTPEQTPAVAAGGCGSRAKKGLAQGSMARRAPDAAARRLVLGEVQPSATE